MNDIELSQIRVELTRLFEEQVEFFRKRSLVSGIKLRLLCPPGAYDLFGYRSTLAILRQHPSFVSQGCAMPFQVIRISRELLAWALLIIFAIPQDLFTQTPHLVSPTDLKNELLTATRRREQNQLTVRQFLASADAQQAFRSVHLDPVQVTTAVATLSDTELAQLAARADKAQRDFAAGALSKETLLIIAVAVAVVIIIIAVKT